MATLGADNVRAHRRRSGADRGHLLARDASRNTFAGIVALPNRVRNSDTSSCAVVSRAAVLPGAALTTFVKIPSGGTFPRLAGDDGIPASVDLGHMARGQDGRRCRTWPR